MRASHVDGCYETEDEDSASDEDSDNEDQEDGGNNSDQSDDEEFKSEPSIRVSQKSKNYMDKVYKNGSMYTDQSFGSITLSPWLILFNKDKFKAVFTDYCIQEGFAVVVVRGEKHRYTAECATEGCKWRIHACRLPDKVSWAIKTLNPNHKNCQRLQRNPMAKSECVCEKIMDDVKANPKIPVDTIYDYCMDRFQLDMNKRTLYKVRKMALEKINGRYDKSYNLIAAYCEVVKKSNPGSFALITCHSPYAPHDKSVYFKACFIAFAAQVKGFLKGCRPLIGVDGTHLTGTYKEVLLSAMTLDANNELFVIAYAIVGAECTESWRYFFRNLRSVFRQHGSLRDDWSFISDRQKGVDKALYEEFPRATRRVCGQHLYNNFKAHFPGAAFHDLFWRAASAYSPYVYNKALKKMTELDPAVVQWLSKVTQQWSGHTFDGDVVCDQNTSNFVESFNSQFVLQGELPVLMLLEGIRMKYMCKFGERREKALQMNDGHVTPWAREMVEMTIRDSRFCRMTKAGGGEFEIHEGTFHFPVNLNMRKCLCGVWQGTGIPCKHAVRAILHNRQEPLNYVNRYFSAYYYKLTYEDYLHPMPDESQWPAFNFPEVQPPILNRSIGRPTRFRKRKIDEPRKEKRATTIKCSVCKNFGHNSRSCKGGLTAKQMIGVAAIASPSHATNGGSSVAIVEDSMISTATPTGGSLKRKCMANEDRGQGAKRGKKKRADVLATSKKQRVDGVSSEASKKT